MCIRYSFVVKELVDPDEIEFPLQGIPDVKESWPEEVIESGPDEEERDAPRQGSTRPDWIDTKSWRKLQYKDRLRYAEEERQRQEVEAGESFADEGGAEHSADSAATGRLFRDDKDSAMADSHPAGCGGLGEASAATPSTCLLYTSPSPRDS